MKKLKGLRFVVVLCAANLFMSFLFEPVKGSSDTMWTEYYQEDKIDLAFVGASFCAASFVPYVVDEKLGVHSFNLGTPLQAIGQTVHAVETLLEEHKVDTIILGTGFFVLQYETLDAAELTFEKARISKKTGFDKLTDTFEYVFGKEVWSTEKSINYFFPWVYNHENITVEYVCSNVLEKLANLKKDLQRKETEVDSVISKKGFRPYVGTVDESTKWIINSDTYYDQIFLEEKVAEFEKILQLCRQHEVDIIVVNTPHPAYDVVSCYETYETSETEMALICAKYDVEYYNFSLAKPELFEIKDEYFYDFEHLNEEGAEIFSEAICRLLQMRSDGEEIQNYFFTVQEFYKRHFALFEELNDA